MKEQKLNLFLIHNKGTFAKLTKQRLEKFFCIQTFTIRKNYSLKILKNEIYNDINKYKLNLIVYISGETKGRFLYEKHFDLPYFIADICEKKYTFGLPKFIKCIWNTQKKIYGCFNEKVPFNYYGKTKNAFDQSLKTNLNRLRFCSIAGNCYQSLF